MLLLLLHACSGQCAHANLRGNMKLAVNYSSGKLMRLAAIQGINKLPIALKGTGTNVVCNKVLSGAGQRRVILTGIEWHQAVLGLITGPGAQPKV